jgi:hypothetical protein
LVEVVSSNGAVVATGTSGPGGAFRIIQIPAGTYSVRFTSPGWRSTTMDGQVVTAGQTTSFQAAMVEQSYNLNPITVTTSRTEEKVLDAPASVQVVRTARIEARPTTTPVDHVRDEAGVDIIQTGLQSSYVVVRGFNNIFSGATLTLTDNRIARVPSLRANISHLNPITNMDLERMEVVLGPGSALYGPNAANGVVHSITKSPIDYPGVNLSIAGGTRRGAENALPNDSLRNEPMMHAEGRVALAPSDKFGFKVSGQYFDGTEFPFIDPEEAEQQVIATACQGTGYDLTNPACLNFSEGLDLTNSEDQAVLKQSVDNVAKGRQHNLRRWTLEPRDIADRRRRPHQRKQQRGPDGNRCGPGDELGLQLRAGTLPVEGTVRTVLHELERQRGDLPATLRSSADRQVPATGRAAAAFLQARVESSTCVRRGHAADNSEERRHHQRAERGRRRHLGGWRIRPVGVDHQPETRFCGCNAAR